MDGIPLCHALWSLGFPVGAGLIFPYPQGRIAALFLWLRLGPHGVDSVDLHQSSSQKQYRFASEIDPAAAV